MTDDNTLPQEGFIRLPLVLKTLGIAKTTLYDGINADIFPRPMKLGTRFSVWRVDEIRSVLSGEWNVKPDLQHTNDDRPKNTRL